MNKSIYDSHYVNSVLGRIKVLYNLKSDTDLARFLGVNPSTLAMHRKRGKLDFDKVIAVCADADLNWVFRGQAVSESSVPYGNTEEHARIKSELKERLSELMDVVERL